MMLYSNVDDINFHMQTILYEYRGGGWAIVTINYTRTTGDIFPDSSMSYDLNICYIAMPDSQVYSRKLSILRNCFSFVFQILTIIAKVVSTNSIFQPIITG